MYGTATCVPICARMCEDTQRENTIKGKHNAQFIVSHHTHYAHVHITVIYVFLVDILAYI